MRWSLEDLVHATRGRLIGRAPVTALLGVTTDSRRVSPGDVFVAIRGERYDGHRFASAARAAGAAIVVVEADAATVEPRIEVPDTLVALRDLAAHRRDELDLPTVAITGSTGKTSTKDLLAAALRDAWASPRSYNNEVGVPLTVLSCPDDARHLVVEVGSRGEGHIEWLLPAVRPHVAVITNLGLVHLETFGSEARLADAKWELARGVEPSGTVVVPVDEPRLRRPHQGRRLTFGTSAPADVVASEVEVDGEARPTFTLEAEGSRVRLRLRMAGRHQVENAAAAAAAALAVGVSLEDAAAGMAEAEGSPWRMEVRRGRFTVVNDAYNANPRSVAAALEQVADLGGRSLAVLGRMAELGPVSFEEHRRIGELARRLGYALVVVVGAAEGLAEGAGGAAVVVDDVDAAVETVLGAVRAGDSVLVKASRAVGLEVVAERLVEEAGA